LCLQLLQVSTAKINATTGVKEMILYLWGTSLLVDSHLFTLHFSFLFRDPVASSKAGGTGVAGQVEG